MGVSAIDRGVIPAYERVDHSPAIAAKELDTGRNQVRSIIEAVRARYGTVDSSVEIFSSYEGNLTFRTKEIEFEVQGLHKLEERLKEIFEDQQGIEERRDAKIDEVSRARKNQTLVNALQWTVGVAGGLAAGGVPGAMMIGGALVGAAHHVATEYGFYDKAAETIGGTEEEKKSMGKTLENGMAFISFATGLATLFAGGGSAVGAGVKAASEPVLAGMSAIGSAAQGWFNIKQTRVKGEKTELDVEYMGVNLKLNVRRTDRDDGQMRMQDSLESLEKKFGTMAQVVNVLMQITHTTARGSKER